MFREFKFLRRGSAKNEEIENVPQNPRDLPPPSSGSVESIARAPLNAIQEPKLDHEVGSYKSRVDKTPTKHKGGNKYGWVQGSELPSATPRSMRTFAKGSSSSVYSESNSTQNTPCKSVSKPLPPTTSVRGKADSRGVGFTPLYRGVPASSSSCTTVVNSEKVPHFDLKEDPSFWMDHSVQVIIRVRPLNNMERSMNGYSRCLKQESAHSITWIGQPEARFTFDQVACETIDQETLFRMAGLPMVENCLSGYNSCMFAYGQTGSGKTYTMLGENEDLEVKPSPHRGMTPRIFEFLFARIQAEEESRRDEKLKYTCKCSFLEIYNEQITDLLEPSSTNLLLREDVQKGVYVENLSEFEVWSVSDILKLLLQGSSNRKVAATNMNRESSRSHCVFTCIIESRWEKDSMTNLRFARLNLVDLAGSERQKTSGADGERLREAANINKSLSSLGHVIMVLVDVANGKPRHVPYRDSRLTFLLQDSLGGNSKTMIIANISPSICCAAETLNTLKFAQRAKLIQNNAVVNEDTSGDVVSLQNQIRHLKEEILALKHQNVSRSLSFGSPASRDVLHEQESGCSRQTFLTDQQQPEDYLEAEAKGIGLSTKQLKFLETTLAGALRREQMAETSIKQLEAEIEQLNRLVYQREEDTRRTKMMLKFREDKIHRMETLVGGLMPVENYLVEENKRLCEENQLLQAKIERNPEVTRFALENIRLLDQLRRFQEFYEEGERDVLLTDVSNMRDQLLRSLDGYSAQADQSSAVVKPQGATVLCKQSDCLHVELESTLSELEACKKSLDLCVEENVKLSREIQELRAMFIDPRTAPRGLDCIPETTKDSLEVSPMETAKRPEGKIECPLLKHSEEIMNLQLELDILKIILTEEKSSHSKVEERAKRLDEDLNLAKEKLSLTSKEFADVDAELKEAKATIEILVSQQVLAINEMEDLKIDKSCRLELLNRKELEIAALKEQLSHQEFTDQQCSKKLNDGDYPLQKKLMKMQDSLEKAKRLNMWYQSYCDVEASNEEEMDEVRRQAEAETAEVIVCMQEELASLQQQIQEGHLKEMETQENAEVMKINLKELEEKLLFVNEENKQLRDNYEKKDADLTELSEEWELLTCELEEILANGHEELLGASEELDFISSSFPEKRIWISYQVGQMIRIMSEKDLLIEDLTKCLEDADNRRTEVEAMLKSLKGAALAITEAHQQECSEKEGEISLLTSQLSAKNSSLTRLEERMKLAKNEIEKISACATVAFVIVNRYSEINLDHLNTLKQNDIHISDINKMILKKDALLGDQVALLAEAEEQIKLLRKELSESENLCAELQLKLSKEEKHVWDMEQKVEGIQGDDLRKTREKLVELKTGVFTLRSCMSMFVEQHNKNLGKDEHGSQTSRDGPNELQIDSEMNRQSKKDLLSIEGARTGSSSCYSGEQNNSMSHQIISKVCDEDGTITLLRKELELALESLKEVQAEMTKLCDEKEEVCMSDKQNNEHLRCVSLQLISLQTSIVDFEQQCAKKLETCSHKLHLFEQIVEETVTSCYLKNEFLKREVSEARETAVYKMAEASCILSKFEESQETIKDLSIANETLKIDTERLAEAELIVRNERDTLITEIQDLQTINDAKSQKIDNLVNHIESSFMETRDLVIELEEAVAQFHNSISEQIMPLVLDFHDTKSVYIDSSKLVRSWLEKIWSEIITKDCALSVLHLCHIGILLEKVTGLTVENGLLQHGLCESNSVIADLRELNVKSRTELEGSIVTLRNKLLGDLKTNFSRIFRNEEETGQFNIKLSDFEKRISGLQSQEELMLQRCNSMGSQLALLVEELNWSNSNVMESLLDHNKMMKDKDEELRLQEELYMIELYSKDLQLFIFTSKLGEVYFQKYVFERQCNNHGTVFENFKKDITLSLVDAELMQQIVVENDFQIVFLEKEVEEAAKKTNKLLFDLNNRKLTIEEICSVNKALKEEIQSFRNIVHANDELKREICDANEAKMRLLNQIQKLEADHEQLKEDTKQKQVLIESTSVSVDALDEQNKQLKEDISMLEKSADGLQREIHLRDAELSSCHEFLENLKEDIIICNVDLWLKEDFLLDAEDDMSCFQNKINEVEKEREVLLLQLNLRDSKVRNMAEVNQALEQDNLALKDVASSNCTLKGQLAAALEENIKMLKDLQSLDGEYQSLLKEIEIRQKALDSSSTQISILEQQNQKLKQDIETLETSSCRLQNDLEMKEVKLGNLNSLEVEIQNLQDQISDSETRISSLQSELLRKDGVIKGLSFDLSLLQESAANTTDQKDEIDRLCASLHDLEDVLGLKTGKLNDVIAQCEMFETQLEEKMSTVSALESKILKQCETIEFLRAKNNDLRAQADSLLEEKKSMEVELSEERKANENLEMEVSQLGNVIDQLKNNMDELTAERDHLNWEIHNLKENLNRVQAQSQANEENATEAHQLAESRKAFALEKEEEVKLLERSVEELECTVDVLENKVDLIKGEAERQRLQREDLELELHAVRHQLQTIKNSDADLKSQLDMKEKSLQDALRNLKALEVEVAEKGAEIGKLTAHIDELNLHAEAQASEYKQKFKELEAMVEQVRLDIPSSHAQNSSLNKSDKLPVRSRGSGSPFKCIGLGLAQQMKSERDEDITAARQRIEELESLAVSRQKEIFALNARLASAESMTHDVIRDLLGVKLDVTTYASMLDNQQLQRIAKKAQNQTPESQDEEVSRLKQQLSELIEQRKRLLEEIDRRQAELVATQISLEQLCQQDQLIKTEYEMLKVENINHKKKVMELEGEVKKLSGQQNLQQRIHHHAKIKEENNMLKLQIEELSSKLHRNELRLSRARDELARHRTFCQEANLIA